MDHVKPNRSDRTTHPWIYGRDRSEPLPQGSMSAAMGAPHCMTVAPADATTVPRSVRTKHRCFGKIWRWAATKMLPTIVCAVGLHASAASSASETRQSCVTRLEQLSPFLDPSKRTPAVTFVRGPKCGSRCDISLADKSHKTLVSLAVAENATLCISDDNEITISRPYDKNNCNSKYILQTRIIDDGEYHFHISYFTRTDSKRIPAECLRAEAGSGGVNENAYATKSSAGGVLMINETFARPDGQSRIILPRRK